MAKEININNFRFELFEFEFEKENYTTELAKIEIIKLCTNQNIKNLNEKTDIVIFFEILSYPQNKMRFYVDYISVVNTKVLCIKLIKFRYINYIGILKNQSNPNDTIKSIKNYITNSIEWGSNRDFNT